jgi:dynein heavy chain 1
LLKEVIYGGRLDNEFDQKLLDTFISTFLSPACYESGFKLVAPSKGHEEVVVPDGTRLDQFKHWCEALVGRQTPSWFGLAEDADNVLLESHGNN